MIATTAPATKIRDRLKAQNAVTIEAWIKPDNDAQGGPARIVSLGRGTNDRQFMFGQQATSFRVRLMTVGNDGSKADGVDVSLHHEVGPTIVELHHVVFTRDPAGTRVFWLDGQRGTSAPLPNDFANWTEDFHLSVASENPNAGQTEPKDRFWHGELHLVAIYDRALAEEEVAGNFLAGPYP